MTAQVPQLFKDAMSAQGIKNLRQLTLKMNQAPSAVHRIFDGTNAHTALRTYKRIAEICGWSLDEFFNLAHANKPEHVSFILRGRLKALNISTTGFTRYLTGGTANGGSALRYLSGEISYDRLDLYWSLKTALGITADTMYESLIISEDLTATYPGGIISTSKAISVQGALNKYSVYHHASRIAS